LLDSNVLSEPTKPNPNRGVVEWLGSVSEDVAFVSVISLGEIRRGIERLAASKKKLALEGFLQALHSRFGKRALPIDASVADRWGRLIASLEAVGTRLSPADALIAATALEHGLTIVSRDAGYFAVTGVALLDPFA
jgi:predicted nucleic acid-binding protein